MDKKPFFITKQNIFVFFIAGVLAGGISGYISASIALGKPLWQFQLFQNKNIEESNMDAADTPRVIVKNMTEESAVISAVEEVSPAVVSIVITKDIPKIEQYYRSPFPDSFGEFFGNNFDDLFQFGMPEYRQNGTEKKEVGGGTGFLISSDGYVVTNRHVVLDKEAEYTVLLNDETKHNATVLARDSITDFAILKIEGTNFPTLELGTSEGLKVGQVVIAIGNALGEFRNTVSTGVISGLSRSIVASGGGEMGERLTGVIQTDASINPGNSGGPLLNLIGQVIGINTAIVQGAQNIGFAIPIDEVKKNIESVQQTGRIIRPWLGVRYIPITAALAKENQLPVDYGVLITRGETPEEVAVVPGSPADKAGLEENDIIIKVNSKEINENTPLNKAISQFSPGESIEITLLHKGQERTLTVKLDQMPQFDQ